LDRSITLENADFVIQQKNKLPWIKTSPNIIFGVTDNISKWLHLEIPCKYVDPVEYITLPEKKFYDFPYIVINTGYQRSGTD
jgi:hypothetical protein